ncbi:hypothetical protein G9P44_004630 [Scheffersomyces stipitis]|nr:hypothetical protein G9P44_004630 [Scheffersomyces stipitis]
MGGLLRKKKRDSSSTLPKSASSHSISSAANSVQKSTRNRSNSSVNKTSNNNGVSSVSHSNSISRTRRDSLSKIDTTTPGPATSHYPLTIEGSPMSPNVPEQRVQIASPPQVDETTAGRQPHSERLLPVKSDSNGFLSSILNAANNIISSTVTDDNKIEASTTSVTSGRSSIDNLRITPSHSRKEAKEHSFSNRLDFLLKPARFGSSKSSFDEEQADILMNTDNAEVKEPSEPKMPSSPLSTVNVQFESIRESPLNTLGQGDLSLAAFDKAQPKSAAQGDISMTVGSSMEPNFETETRSRFLASPRESTDNLVDIKRSLSPDIVNRQSSNAVNTVSDVKRPRRKSNIVTASSVPTVSMARSVSRTDNRIDNLEKVVSPSGDSNSKSRSTDADLDESDAALYSEDESSDRDESEVIDYSNLKYASRKRNKEFHSVFKKLPSSDPLIDDFSCALSKDILVQGRMYLSSNYICFNSNILGWVTNLVIPLQEVIQVEKKSTAVLFPNGMIIRTLHHRYVFATFLSRDTTFNLITNVWHKVLLETADDSKLAVKRRARGNSRSTGASKSVSRDRYDGTNSLNDEYDISEVDSRRDVLSASHDEEDDFDGSFSSLSLHSDKDNDDEEAGSDSGSVKGGDHTPSSANKSMSRDEGTNGSAEQGANTFKGFPMVGPMAHAPTDINYTKKASETFISEGVLKAPVGAVFSILFGADTSLFIKILKKQKNFDITESEITPLSPKNKERHYSYIKPLGGPIGPKQTKCIIVEKITEFNPENYILVEQVTSTPDVPSGNSFSVKTKMFFSWVESNHTRLYVVTSIEWTGKSWIKGAIEKGSIDGQKESMKVIMDSLDEMISTGNEGAGKGKQAKSKKKGTRSRKNTIVKKPSIEKEPEVVKELGVGEKFMDFVESLGKLLPIPYLGDLITGFIVLFIGIMISFRLFNAITGGSSKRVQFIPEDSYVSKIRIDDNKYIIIPSIDTNFHNKKIVMENEVNLWNWVRERSEDKIKIVSDDNSSSGPIGKNDARKDYADQEVYEIVKITQMKLGQLSEKLK